MMNWGEGKSGCVCGGVSFRCGTGRRNGVFENVPERKKKKKNVL